MMRTETGKSQVAAAILKQLKDPFKPNLVKYAQVGGNKTIAYVDARDVEKRLDDILGTENWEDNYIEVDGGFVCNLTIVMDGKKVTKSGVSNNTKIAPLKGGESGALKRAAVKFGVGRYFYYFDPLKWTQRNVDEWPEIFKPGARENWEDVAELKYGLLAGMEESEIGENFVENLDKMRATTTTEELTMLYEGFDKETQAKLGTEFTKKFSELVKSNGTDQLN